MNFFSELGDLLVALGVVVFVLHKCIVVNLQTPQLLPPLFIIFTQYLQPFLIVIDSSEELSVGLLLSNEAVHYVLDVGVTSLRANGLESLLNLVRPLHLIVHLLLVEETP